MKILEDKISFDGLGDSFYRSKKLEFEGGFYCFTASLSFDTSHLSYACKADREDFEEEIDQVWFNCSKLKDEYINIKPEDWHVIHKDIIFYRNLKGDLKKAFKEFMSVSLCKYLEAFDKEKIKIKLLYEDWIKGES